MESKKSEAPSRKVKSCCLQHIVVSVSSCQHMAYGDLPFFEK